jgi:hypothetical protein
MAAALEVANRHMDHALDHGMEPGHTYALHLHGDPTPLVGTLHGTSDLGALFRGAGSKFVGFHPWSAIQGLIRQPD